MSTRQGNFKDYVGNKIAPNTCSAAVLDEARSQGLSASLAALVEKNALGYPTFSTAIGNSAGDIVFYDRKLYVFTANKAAGDWDPTKVSEIGVKQILAAALLLKAGINDLEDGIVVPALAKDLESWANRSLAPNVSSPMSGVQVRTTAGSASIVTSVAALIKTIRAMSQVCTPSSYMASGWNLLRLASNGGVAVKGSGDWWYFPCAKLTFVGYGSHNANNGLILTDSEGNNISNAVLYYKPFASGVPTSATDGTPLTETVESGIAFYAGTAAEGWIIVSGITWETTCAHLAWSITAKYGFYVSPTAESDGGSSIDLTPLGNLYKSGSKADYAEYVDDTHMTLHHLCGTATPEWTTVADAVEQGETQTYTHTAAAINGMKSGGEVMVTISGVEQTVTVDGTAISIQDTNDASAWDALTKVVTYEAAAETTESKTLSSLRPSVNDMGIEVFTATGAAFLDIMYAQGLLDTVAFICSDWQPGIQDEVALLAEENDELTQALYIEQAKDPDMKYGQPRILWGNGTPAENTVPSNWRQFLDGGYNWIGKPAFVGQVYINTAVTTGGYYLGYLKSDFELAWRTIVA